MVHGKVYVVCVNWFIFFQHLYVSLSELQVKREEEIAKNPLSKPEVDVPNTASELLFQAILPNLPQYMVRVIN